MGAPTNPVMTSDISVIIPALGEEYYRWTQYEPRVPWSFAWEQEFPEEYQQVYQRFMKSDSGLFGPDDMGISVRLYMERAYGPRVIARLTGYGPNKLRRMVQKALNDKWFVNPWTNLLARMSKKRWNANIVELVSDRAYLIPQYEADDQTNMIPLALASGLGSEQLRAYVGKKAWKRLIHNSVSRNVLIARRWLGSSCYADAAEGRAVLRHLSRVPSTLLRSRYNEKTFPEEALNMRPYKALVEEHARLLYMLDDITRRSPRRPRGVSDIERLHDEVFPGIRSSSEPKLPPLDVAPLEGTLRNGVEYRLLRTQDEYQEEGKEMHHCVGSFYSAAYNGMLHVMSLRGSVKGTISFRILKDEDQMLGVTIGQCYGPCNKPIKNRASFESQLSELVAQHIQQQQCAA